jgi:hypothetical protein
MRKQETRALSSGFFACFPRPRARPAPRCQGAAEVAGPSWLTGTLAAVMIRTACYSASRLVLSRLREPTTDADADGLHAVMGTAMAGMHRVRPIETGHSLPPIPRPARSSAEDPHGVGLWRHSQPEETTPRTRRHGYRSRTAQARGSQACTGESSMIISRGAQIRSLCAPASTE